MHEVNTVNQRELFTFQQNFLDTQRKVNVSEKTFASVGNFYHDTEGMIACVAIRLRKCRQTQLQDDLNIIRSKSNCHLETSFEA